MAESQLLTADLVFPVTGPAISKGGVRIRDGKIEAVGRAEELAIPIRAGESAPRRHLAGCALVPGFVNAHTHVELSAMAGQIPRPAAGENFTHWIRRLLTIREAWTPADLDASSREGVRQILEGGATTIGDITAGGLSLASITDSGLRAVVFREVLGFGKDREAAAAAICRQWLGDSGSVKAASSGRVRLGLSPHAPHSTSPGIYRDCVRLAHDAGCLLATHVSETQEELEMIRSGGGPFGTLLAARQHSMEGWGPPGVSPVRYLHDLGVLAAHGLAIHVNYPEAGDLELIAAGSLTPVFCPQSHCFLGHSRHPADRMLSMGLLPALGTDSLASSDSLAMLDELRTARRLFPHISASRWLDCATLNGARSLGLSDIIGSLEPGKCADLAVIALQDPAGDDKPGCSPDPADCLLAHGTRSVGTMIDGRWIVEPPR